MYDYQVIPEEKSSAFGATKHRKKKSTGTEARDTELLIEQCERVGVRIVAMDDYDSHKESDELILGIRAWSNERVVKDTSAKIWFFTES